MKFALFFLNCRLLYSYLSCIVTVPCDCVHPLCRGKVHNNGSPSIRRGQRKDSLCEAESEGLVSKYKLTLPSALFDWTLNFRELC